MRVLLTDNDKGACEWLENLLRERFQLFGPHVKEAHVLCEDVRELGEADLEGFQQAHFFAGIGGWPLALWMAGWPGDREVWTASLPCQPFSNAGSRKGESDERHLWPVFRGLVAERMPATLFGEQVASAAGRGWLARVRADLEALGYAVGAADLCAAGEGAPHIRQRLFWVADHNDHGLRRTNLPGGLVGKPDIVSPGGCPVGPVANGGHPERGADGGPHDLGGRDASGLRGPEGAVELGGGGAVGHGHGTGLRERGGSVPAGARHPTAQCPGVPRHWDGAVPILCRDGKARRVEPGIFPVAHGVSGRVAVGSPTGEGGERWVRRVAALRGAGNAIVPQVAATFVRAFLDEKKS